MSLSCYLCALTLLVQGPFLPLVKSPFRSFWFLWSLPNFFPPFLHSPVLGLVSAIRKSSSACCTSDSFCIWQCSQKPLFYIPQRMTYTYMCSMGSRGEQRTLGVQLKGFGGPRVWLQALRLILTSISCHAAFPIRARIWPHLSFSLHSAYPGTRPTTGAQ